MKNQNNNNLVITNSNTNREKMAMVEYVLSTIKHTPFPYSPKKGKNPVYFNGEKLTSLSWSELKDLRKLNSEKINQIKSYFESDLITAVGMATGYNGEMIIGCIDFDRKNFDSIESMNQKVNDWVDCYPGLKFAPKLSSQSGGIHFIIGFKDVSDRNIFNFNLDKDSEKKLGEAFVGGHPCIMLGDGYEWLENEYAEIPVFDSPEAIGIFETKNKINNHPKNSNSYESSEEAREALSYIPVTNFDDDYQGWINVGMACHAAGLNFEDWDNWSRGSKKYSTSKQNFSHWKSFNNNGGITKNTLFGFAKDNGWSVQNATKKINLSGEKTMKNETVETIENEILKLTEKNLTKSKLQIQLNEISLKFGIHIKEIEKIYKNIQQEIENNESKNQIKFELDELLKSKNQSLVMTDYLPDNLSMISEFASRLCLRPETALTAFITTCSSLLKVGSKIYLSNYSNFKQPMGIYAAIVAEPSQQKSPLINEIILEPLIELAEIEQKNYENAFKNYQIEYQLWETDKNGDEPVKPIKRHHYITSGTQAGIRNILDKQSQQGWGLLQVSDEIAGSYKSSGKSYNVGQIEDDLAYYDARGTSEAQKDGLVSNNRKCLFSKFGGIQPDVIKEFLNGTDTNGYWSRWTFINQPVTPFLIPDNPPPPISVVPMLTDFYNKLTNLPLLNLRLDSKAEKYFDNLQNQAEINRVNAKTPALAALWGKIRGKIGRYTAIIHIIQQVWQYGTVQDSNVTVETLKKAERLAMFYFNESLSLYTACTEGSLPATLDAILDLAKKKNVPITAREVKQFKKTTFSDISVEDIRLMFTQLSEMGHGTLEGSGSRLKFSNCSNCSKTVEDISTAKTYIYKDLHPSVVNVEEKKEIYRESTTFILDESDKTENFTDPPKSSTVTTVEPKSVSKPYTEGVSTVEKSSTVASTVSTSSTVCGISTENNPILDEWGSSNYGFLRSRSLKSS